MIPDLTVYIGWDSREPASAAVLAHSILTRASIPVTMGFVTQKAVSRIYTRPRGATESTEFSLTRFLVPYLSGYKGYSLFLDCDMLMRVDVLELLLYPLANPDKAVWVCPHDYTPKNSTKFLGQVQTTYPRKNWSSFMLFDNAKCRALTPEYVNTASGSDLHRFAWLRECCARCPSTPGRRWLGEMDFRCDGCDGSGYNESIGHLPLEWNWLIGEYPANEHAKAYHWTLGGPWFPEYANCDHADEWRKARDDMAGIVRTDDDRAGDRGQVASAVLVGGRSPC